MLEPLRVIELQIQGVLEVWLGEASPQKVLKYWEDLFLRYGIILQHQDIVWIVGLQG